MSISLQRTSLLSFVILNFWLTSPAQEVVIKSGIGLNFTNFSKEPYGNAYKAKVGYEIGGNVSFGRKFYVQPGIFYVRKSTNYTVSSADSTTVSGANKGNFAMSGLRIPVAIGYSIIGGEHPGDPFGLRVYGGGSAFFLMKTNQGDIDLYNKAAWGVFAGLGFDIGILFIDASYEWSLTNIQKDISTVDIGKTRSLYLDAGLRFPIGK